MCMFSFFQRTMIAKYYSLLPVYQVAWDSPQHQKLLFYILHLHHPFINVAARSHSIRGTLRQCSASLNSYSHSSTAVAYQNTHSVPNVSKFNAHSFVSLPEWIWWGVVTSFSRVHCYSCRENIISCLDFFASSNTAFKSSCRYVWAQLFWCLLQKSVKVSSGMNHVLSRALRATAKVGFSRSLWLWRRSSHRNVALCIQSHVWPWLNGRKICLGLSTGNALLLPWGRGFHPNDQGP